MPSPFPQSANSHAAPSIQQALTLHRQGDLAAAEKIYKRILKSQPEHFDALHLLGMLYLQRGKAGEALRLVSAALKLNPNSPDALSNLGLVLRALKRGEEALENFDKAIALQPNHVDALNNRGNALLDRGRFEEALTCFDRVLALQPRHVEARINRGNAFHHLGRYNEAIAGYDAAIALVPAHPGAHFNRGNALYATGLLSEALAAYDRALAIKPDHARAWNSRGVALQALNRHHDAVASFDKSLSIAQDYADAHFNAALSLLTIGEYRRGFDQYEWRWKRTGMENARRNFRQPLWLGEYPLARKTILLHAEQGFGDTIQFIRYVPMLLNAGAQVILELPPELKVLLSDFDPRLHVIARGDTPPAFDVHCPLGSLPLAFKTEFAKIPADIPYLRAAAERVATERVAMWRERLAAVEPLRVAIAWSGRATHANDRNRSIALSRLVPLLSLEGVRFVSIQHEPRGEDAGLFAREPRILHLGDDLRDFADTAAVLDLADLVVSVDTSVAHLAAAMGRPVWLLLPFSPDWRWTLDHESSPWYPAARLFRQPRPGDWESVVTRLGEELTKWAGGPR